MFFEEAQEVVRSMKCENVRELFSEYYDGETSLDVEITEHLDGCPRCSEEYEKFFHMLEGVANLPEPEVPSGFRQGLMAHAEGYFRGRKTGFTRVRFISALSSVAAAAASVLLVWYLGIFDTGLHYESPDMLAMPMAVMENFSFDDYYPQTGIAVGDAEREDLSPLLRVIEPEFDYDEEGFMGTGPFAEDTWVFEPWEPVFVYVGYPVVVYVEVLRPNFLTAGIFLAIGLLLGNVGRIARFIGRKRNDAI